jgi:sigma-B regulation protein RsbU (phosphoserine phosphatase)
MATKPQPRLFKTLTDDVRVVFGDFRQHGAKRTVGGTLANIEAFYLTDDDRRRLTTMRPFRRFVHRAWWFVKGLLMKLTPARRVILAAALVYLVLGVLRVDIGSVHVSFPVSAIVGNVLLLGVLALELKDKLVARDELEAGRQVQLALMPAESPTVPGWDVWLYTRPANDVGGDLVDYLPLGGGRHAVTLGDVSGKALPAALLSVKLQATLRALAPHVDGLGELADHVNRILYRDGLPARFASLVYLVLSEGSGHVRVLNAGHMPPIVLRGSEVSSMPRGSMVLGIMPEATFSEQPIDLGPRDALIVYSDGVSEAMNDAGDFFGDERLVGAIARTPWASSSIVGHRILEALRRFVGDAPTHDDVSLMVLRRT